jgi:hypothetical protein
MHVRKIGLQFSGFDFAPFLNTGVTIASLQSVGTVPVLSDDWNKSDIIGEISSCTSFRKWGEILSRPIALVGFRFFHAFSVKF